MLVSPRAIKHLVEAVELAGLDPARVIEGTDYREGDKNLVPWRTMTHMFANLSRLVDGDSERLRAIGLGLNRVPSYAFVGLLGRTVLSVRMLYEIAERWVAPANFPHVRLFHRFISGDRLAIHLAIPPLAEASEAFLQFTAGAMMGLPIAIGLPPCELLDVQFTPRTIDLELRMPSQRSLFGAGIRAGRRLFRRGDREELLEGERRHLFEGLTATQRTNDELRNVLEILPDLVVIHVQGRIVFVNRAFVRSLGWSSAEELIGRKLVDCVDTRSQGLFAARYAQPAGTPGLPELTEAWLVTQTGDPILVEVAPPQAVVFDGRSARLVVGRDIAESDRLKQQLATADRLASLGLLAAGVAHEVNNPLGYLLNNIEIARRQLAGLGPGADVARDALQVALEGVDRIRFIVRELLLLARAEPTPLASTDLPSAIESTLALARVEITRTARLVVELDAVAPVKGSVPRIAQIVLNLVLNALEAMRARGPAENELTIRVKRAGEGRVVLEIADNGPGVAAKDATRLFDPFFTTKSPGRGTGLGLAITQRLVTELDGEISFTSEPGRGTTFRVLFRVHEEHAPQRAMLD